MVSHVGLRRQCSGMLVVVVVCIAGVAVAAVSCRARCGAP